MAPSQPSILACHTNPLHVLHHTSMNFLCDLLLFLLPVSSIISILCSLYPLSLLCTCANHLSLLSLPMKVSSTLPPPLRIHKPVKVMSKGSI